MNSILCVEIEGVKSPSELASFIDRTRDGHTGGAQAEGTREPHGLSRAEILKNYARSCKVEMANPFEVFYFPYASYFKQSIYISFFLTF